MAGYRVHICLRLLGRYSGLQAANGHQPVVVVVDLLGGEGQGRGQLRTKAVGKAGRKHADHGVGCAVDAHGLAENIPVRSQAVPQVVREDDLVVPPRHALFGKEISPHGEGDALQAEPAGRGETGGELLGLVSGGEIQARFSPGGQLLKRLALPLPVDEVAGREHVSVATHLGPDNHELAGLGIRQRREERGIDHGVNGRGCADSQGERCDDSKREPQVSAEHTQSVKKVPEHKAHRLGAC